MNKAGFSPLTLVTGKAVSIPGLTLDTEGSENFTDAEAVSKTMETINKVTRKFREAEPNAELKNCQGIRARSHQHQGNYIAGDKVWYQYKDGNAWHGPAEVIYQKGNAIFIHGNGDVKKIAACKVKPYDLKERIEKENNPNNDEEKSPDIQEDNNSENIDNKKEIDAETEEIEDENEVRRDFQNEIIRADDLQREKSIYGGDEAFFLEIPKKEYGTLKIVNTNKRMENLRTYKTIDKVLDEKETQGTDETNVTAVMNAIANKQQPPL